MSAIAILLLFLALARGLRLHGLADADALAHEDDARCAARHRAPDEQQIARLVGADDFEVERGDAIDSEVAGPSAALDRLRRVRVAVGRRLAMDHRAVARAAAAAVPAFHDAREAFAFARADDVDAIAG